jgi:hypothetical protein
MRIIISIFNKLWKTIVSIAVVILAGGSELFAQPFSLYAVSDLVRIFEDGYNLPAKEDTIKVFGIRGEIISGQCFLISKINLSNVSLELSPLRNQSSGEILRTAFLEANFVGSIPLSKNTPNQPVRILSRPAPARYPDYLMFENKINVSKGICQSIWLTIDIPLNADSGGYVSSITVKSQQGDKSIPVSLSIYPFTLPQERHLKAVEWYTTEEFERFYGIKEKYSEAWFSMLKIYAENMVSHRQNVFSVPMKSIEIRRLADGELEFDFSRFDQIARVFWNTGKMDWLETGFLTRFGDGDWFSTEIFLNDIEVTDLETGNKVILPGKNIIPYLIPAFESHLRQEGWLQKTLFHVKDEPSIHNAIAWMEMSNYFHKYAPDLKRIDAIETTFLLKDIEVAVPKLDALGVWYDSYKEWQQCGNELWFYTVGIYQGSFFPDKTIDMPLIDSRIMHWLNYKYDAIGYLHWGWNQWNENPYQDVGMHIGDAWHVYPAKDGVLNSLRWEQMRNGIQDYEYFWLLENKISTLKDSLGSRFDWIDPKHRSKEIAGRVVMSLSEHSDDPQVLYAAKKEILDELLESEKSPRIYVQTDPVENSVLTSHSSVAVFGWTEPGTDISINGIKVPVSEQGLFLEQFTMSPEENRIVVQGTNAVGSKKIIRDYEIKY